LEEASATDLDSGTDLRAGRQHGLEEFKEDEVVCTVGPRDDVTVLPARPRVFPVAVMKGSRFSKESMPVRGKTQGGTYISIPSSENLLNKPSIFEARFFRFESLATAVEKCLRRRETKWDRLSDQ
jgi:hypothetical protein